MSRQDALRALSEMREYLDQEVEPELDIIERWANAFDALLSGGGDAEDAA